MTQARTSSGGGDMKSLAANYDLMVMGGGLAGHCAALEAADRGRRILLVEKLAKYGGSTVLSAGSFAFAGTDLQREAGIEDNPANMRADIVRASLDRCDPALVDAYMELQLQTFSWLRNKGVEFQRIQLSSNQGTPRSHPADPQQLMDALNARVVEHPLITYLPNTETLDLVDTAAGVRGAVISVDGKRQAIRSADGVVLACGGFSRNRELVTKFVPQLENALAVGGSGNRGDGLLLAWKRGADVADMGYINGTFGVSLMNYPDLDVKPDDNPPLRLANYRGGIAVNLEARRFADESISYKTLGERCLAQPKAVGFQLFDQKIMDKSMPTPTSNDLKGAYERGLIKSGPTLRSVAAQVGIDADVLEATVKRYNEGVDAGRETEFGRYSLGKGVGAIEKIEVAPFYIFPCTTAIVSTYCGVKVDADMHVLDVYGKPIAGLYAAGEIVGGFHGGGYMSGSSLGKAAIFGRVAAATAIGTGVSNQ